MLTVIAAALGACNDPQALDPAPRSPGPTIVAGSATYELIDLGGLGGTQVEPLAVNDRGQVVGYGTTLTGQARAFLWENGTMSDLGAVTTRNKGARAINNGGQIAGTDLCCGYTDGWLWKTGLLQEFGIANATVSVRGLSETGVVLMSVDRFNRTEGLLWKAGSQTALGHLSDASITLARRMNNAGQIVGQSLLYGPGGSTYGHPFLWQNGVMQDLGVLGPSTFEGEATDINDAGTIVGWSVDSSWTRRAFLWKNGQMRDLGGFPGEPTDALQINERAQVLATHGSQHIPALWDGGVWKDLGTLGEGSVSLVAMNDNAEIVGHGWYPAGQRRAWVWQEGQMYDLGVGDPPGESSYVTGINARGDIIGVIEVDQSPVRAVMWRKR